MSLATCREGARPERERLMRSTHTVLKGGGRRWRRGGVLRSKDERRESVGEKEGIMEDDEAEADSECEGNVTRRNVGRVEAGQR